MSDERIEVWDRVYFDSSGEATHWFRSMDKGLTWELVDCSAYGGKPPFIRFPNFGPSQWVEQHEWRRGG